MMKPNHEVLWRNPRPQLTIECTRGFQISNCYSGALWRVTSDRRLSRGTLEALNNAGVLGFGQEFRILSRADGSEDPAGKDAIQPSVRDRVTGNLVEGEIAVDYLGKPHTAMEMPFWIYECESRCDSGD